jgi:phosphinothricin acetyltransferase
MGHCRFEVMTEAYLPQVLEIYNYYILNSTATFHYHPLTLAEMREILFFEDPKYTSYAILDDDELCGYCILCPFKKREAYNISAEITVYLKPGATGKGLGGEAIRHIAAVAETRGIHSLIAIICSENTASVSLFERNGYHQCSHYREIGQKFGRLLDVVCYQKILPLQQGG